MIARVVNTLSTKTEINVAPQILSNVTWGIRDVFRKINGIKWEFFPY